MDIHNQSGENNYFWKGGRSTFQCVECGKEFKDYHRKRADRKFCSAECGYKNKQRKMFIQCEYCGKEKEVLIYDIKRGKGRFCSKKCSGLSRADVISKKFKGQHKSEKWKNNISRGLRNSLAFKKYIENFSENQMGDKNPNWKGGITAESSKIRSSPNFKLWREQIFKRDYYTCVRCMSGNCILHAHHIIPFMVAPEERLELNNGATLCVPCHRWIHSNELNT